MQHPVVGVQGSAVSHDLRTPLASIKMSVTSLLQHDVDWTPEATDSFLQTIDAETDRLNTLVGNLLDMGRLEPARSTSAPGPSASRTRWPRPW